MSYEIKFENRENEVWTIRCENMMHELNTQFLRLIRPERYNFEQKKWELMRTMIIPLRKVNMIFAIDDKPKHEQKTIEDFTENE